MVKLIVVKKGEIAIEYYKERNLSLDTSYKLDLFKLREYFFHIYRYFNNKMYFEIARNGFEVRNQYGQVTKNYPPLYIPSEEVFFMMHLRSDDVFPILENYESYSEEVLFTVIEILYSKVAIYNEDTSAIETSEVKKEFEEQINNLLKLYESGYYLEPNIGTIIHLPNTAQKNLFEEKLEEYLEDTVTSQLQTAFKMYYKFDANLEEKKKAINILADVLEPLRGDLKNILDDECNVNKRQHDALIFNIVNNFNIRHNDENQKKDYEHNIWYDWMMHYYSSVIIAYYKLKKINSSKNNLSNKI